MAEEIDLENGRISNFQSHDLDVGSGRMEYRRASLIDLYLHIKFHSNPRNFVDVRIDIEAGFINVTLW